NALIMREKRVLEAENASPSLDQEKQLSAADQKLLHSFVNTMKKLRNNLCGVCNEQFPSIEIVKGKCRRCYNKKNTPKKFSAKNNMDPELLENNESDENDDFISQTFVPALPPGNSENNAICNTLNRLQNNCPPNENLIINWPHIDSTPIDEFHTVEYMARAFPTLFPCGVADLHAHLVREVKPAEYFQYLLKYKDALAEGRIYVKQNLEEGQLTVAKIQELLQSDTHMADRVV
ncbi:15260_t:CDS:2, partial [Racocetra fulgida]